MFVLSGVEFVIPLSFVPQQRSGSSFISSDLCFVIRGGPSYRHQPPYLTRRGRRSTFRPESMLKTWLKLPMRAACALLLLTSALAQEQRNEILFLHLRQDANGITLVRSDSHPGQLKPQSEDGAIQFEVSSPENVLIHSGRMPDPLLQRLEYPDASEPGRLRTELLPRESAEFTLRLPRSTAGRALRFFRRTAFQEGKLRTLAVREFLGEVIIPENPAGLQALATGGKLSTLLTNGPTASRLNIAILAEGFTTAEEGTFTNRARTVLQTFLNTSPYNEYRNHFNAFAIFVASAQSGSDHPSRNTYRNTYFNSSYDSFGLDRLITIPPNDRNSSYSAGQGKVVALLSQFLPEYDIALLLVNDDEYGGSGGVPSIASINSSSAEIALHEIAHSFAGLGDEYDSPYPGYPDTEEPNTTRETRRNLIKWRDWIEPFTPIPTPETSTFANQVGLFEGAHFHTEGWYRPKLDCKMQTLEVDFCEVCKEALVLSAYTKLNLLQGSSPTANNLTVPGGGEIMLAVQTIPPAISPLTYTWTIDGVTNVAFSSNNFPASFATLGIGRRLVRVQINDETPLVRTDRDGTLFKSRSWLVEVLSATNEPPTISEIPNQQTASGQSVGPIPFTIGDPDTPLAALSLSARSSSTNLVPDANIIIVGTGTNRSLTIATHPRNFGVSTITVSVSDGTQTTSETFDVVVLDATPDLGVEPIPDQQVFSGPLNIPIRVSGSGYGPLSFFATASDPLLLPESGIKFSNLNGEHLLTLTPIERGVGQTLVSVIATDGEVVARESFNVTFLPRPAVVGSAPELTSDGIHLRFASDRAATMILEVSQDMKFWSAVTTQQNAMTFEFVVPKPTLAAKAFYRVRLVPL
jgi:hypothetical protein